MKVISLADFGIDEGKIVNVTLDNIHLMLADVHSTKIACIDLESVPSILKYVSSPISTLQLSTPTTTYIIDLLVDPPAHKDLLAALHTGVLSNPEVLKVGVGIDNDVANLKKAFEIPYEMCIRNYISLDDMYKSVTGSGKSSLDHMCEQVLGRPASPRGRGVQAQPGQRVGQEASEEGPAPLRSPRQPRVVRAVQQDPPRPPDRGCSHVH